MSPAGADGNQARRLRGRLKAFFEICGIKKLETPRFSVSVQANGGQAPLVFPPEWETFPENAPEAFHRVEIKLDRHAIREAIRNDEEAHGAFLAERGTRLNIR